MAPSFRLSRGGLISFSSDFPGNHATMFGPNGEKLAFRADASSFNDAARSYTWAFDVGPVVDGDTFVFATVDKTVVGVKTFDGFLVGSKAVAVARDKIGKPVQIGHAVNPVERRST